MVKNTHYSAHIPEHLKAAADSFLDSCNVSRRQVIISMVKKLATRDKAFLEKLLQPIIFEDERVRSNEGDQQADLQAPGSLQSSHLPQESRELETNGGIQSKSQGIDQGNKQLEKKVERLGANEDVTKNQA